MDGIEAENASPTKWSIWKDVIAISFGFVFNFISFNGLGNLQSSLNSDGGLGTASMAVIYALLIMSSCILPPLASKWLGYKWTMVSCIPFYTLYILANFYATWYTLIPASVLVGLVAAPLWSAKCSYLTTLSYQYAKITNESVESVNSKFFGVFFMIFHFDQIIGNLISSLALQTDDTTAALPRTYGLCGSDYCNEDLNSFIRLNKSSSSNDTLVIASARPPLNQVYIMCGIYAALSLCGAFIIAVFVRDMKSTVQDVNAKLEGLELLKVSLLQTTNPYQLLMIPLTVFAGLAQSFMSSDYTKAYVNCALGLHFIGFVMICTGVTDAVFSLVFGIILKVCHRSVVYGFGGVISVAVFVTLAAWHPYPDTPWVFYVIAGFWGVADSVWQTHFNAFYGILFEENLAVAYASYRLWESVGFMTGFAWSSSVCIYLKLYVLIPLLIVGLLCYGVVEIQLYGKLKSSESGRHEVPHSKQKYSND